MAESSKNLYQKISEITESLGVIQKDSAAPKEMGGYRFISHAQMLGHLRHELTARNVVIVPNGMQLIKFDTYATGSGKTGHHTVIQFTFRVINGDKPEEFIEASWFGEGQDTSDKGIQKAGTSAEKYFLMKLFKVSDKDDPDAIQSEPAAAKSNDVPPVILSSDTSLPTITDAAVVKPPVTSVSAERVTAPAHNEEAQIKALVWFGDQLPKTAGWFQGKIVPLVGLWNNKQKSGKLDPEMLEAGSGVKWVFNQIAASHFKVCGENCPHLTAVELAVILDGKISDPISN